MTIVVEGFDDLEGQLVLGIFDDADGFPIDGRQLRKVVLDIDSDKMSHTFENLPSGEYAVAFFHDKNVDGVFNKSFLGLPRERYGFTKIDRRLFAEPDFEDCSFYLDGDEIKTLGFAN